MNHFIRIARNRIDRARRLIHDRMPLLEWSRLFLPHHTERPFSKLHYWLADRLDDATQLRDQKINLVGPRGSAKSTIATLCYLLKRVCEGDEPYIWLISDTKGQAQTHLENIRHELGGNQALQDAYGAHQLARRGQWTEERLQLANGCTIEAYGTGQRLRGRRRGAQRPTLIICDDLQNDAHATSPHLRQTTRHWFAGTLLKAGRANTNIVNVGTALHRDALAMELCRTPGWHSRIFQAIEQWPIRMDLWAQWSEIYNQPEDEDAQHKAHAFYLTHREDMHAGAILTWPEEEPLYRLMRMRIEEGTTAFEREKQSSPIDPDRCEWPEELFRDHIFPTEWPDKFHTTALTLDPSKGRADRTGDWSAYVFAGLAHNNLVYVDCVLVRESSTALVERGVQLWQRWQPDLFGVEATSYQELLINEFHRQFMAANLGHVVITPLEADASKPVRIRRLSGLIAQKRIRFNGSNAHCRELIEQLKEFPIAEYDDGPDALEMAVRMLHEANNLDSIQTSRMRLLS